VNRPRDRAQLILVGGLVVAVGLVALAIVLNSGIYTHNLASRADPTASEAVGHTAAVRDSVGGLVEYEVGHNPDDTSEQVGNVTDGTSNVSAQVARASARRGLLTNATVAAEVNGTTVNQTGDRNFSDSASPPNPSWTVADDTRGVRDFRMDVNRSHLIDEGGALPLSATVFNVTFDTSSEDWVVSVYRDGGTTAVLVINETADRTFGPCTDDTGDWTTIEITRATVAGEHCAALGRIEDLPRPYDVEFDQADNVTGSYSLVANTTSVDVGSPGDAGPSEMETLYAVWVEIAFQSQRVDYRTNVTVAPGEFDG